MNTFAVIDIGSNSVRLMFVADGKVLYKRLNTTRLGEGLADSGVLKAAAIERSALAVAEFMRIAKHEGAEQVFAFATAAVRAAKNGLDFTERVRELCDLKVEIISGEEEAELGILGALGNKDGAVIDIGGASTEIVVRKNGVCVFKKSVDVGVVRLKDCCGREQDLLIQAAKNAADKFIGMPSVSQIYAIGGTATTLTALWLGLTEYRSERITGTRIMAENLQALAETLLQKSVEEIAAMPCMPKGRADVLTGGAVLLVTLLKELKIDALIASDRDNLEGYAIKRGWME